VLPNAFAFETVLGKKLPFTNKSSVRKFTGGQLRSTLINNQTICRCLAMVLCPLPVQKGELKSDSLQEWAMSPTANPYADGQMSVPSA
jgi:hypothetical protein